MYEDIRDNKIAPANDKYNLIILDDVIEHITKNPWSEYAFKDRHKIGQNKELMVWMVSQDRNHIPAPLRRNLKSLVLFGQCSQADKEALVAEVIGRKKQQFFNTAFTKDPYGFIWCNKINGKIWYKQGNELVQYQEA